MSDIYVPVPQPSPFQQQMQAAAQLSDITALQQMNLRADLILGANPYMAQNPDGLMQLAQSGLPYDQLVTNAAAAGGLEHIDGLRTSLEGLNPTAQRAVYSKLTEQQQRALDNLGFQPSQEGKGFLDGTFLEGAWDLAATATDFAFSPIAKVGGYVGGHALDLLTWVGDVPAHFYRAIRQMEGWQQWVAAGAAIAGMALLGPAAAGALAGFGSMGVLAGFGAAGLGTAVASTALTAITNPTEWWDVMNPFGRTGVGRGERVFGRGAQEKVSRMLGGATHLEALAADFAIEMDVEDLAAEFAGVRDASNVNVYASSIERVAGKLANPGTPEYIQIMEGLTKLAEQPEFKTAVDELQGSKISFGRDVANAAQLTPGTGLYTIVSGAADAAWLFALDPVIGLGKLGKLKHIWRFGVQESRGVDAINTFSRMVNEDAAVGALARTVGNAVAHQNFAEMPKQWRPVWEPMTRWMKENARKGINVGEGEEMFLKFLEDGEILKALARGDGTVRGLETTVVSVTNKNRGWGQFVESLRQFERGVSDEVFLDDMFREAERLGTAADLERAVPRYFLSEGVDTRFVVRPLDGTPIPETWSYKSGQAVGKGLLYVPGGRTLANFTSGLMTMIPAGEAIKLTPDSLDDMRTFTEDIPRFVEAMGRHMNLPSYVRDEWLNTIMRQESLVMRRNALVSFMDSTFAATGFHASDKWFEVASKYITKYKQAYGKGGLDVIETPSGPRVVGIMPDADMAAYLVMPDIKTMSQVVRQGHIMKHIAKVTDHDFAEQAMSRFIKPGWLFRIGFIPRAAGEEMLAFWLRMTEGGLMQEFVARRMARYASRDMAHQALEAVGGNIHKLDDATRELIESHRLPAHLRSLAWARRRFGDATPVEDMFARYLDWTHTNRAAGLLRTDVEKWNIPENAKILIAGKEKSIRRLLLEGVDGKLQEAAQAWTLKHSTPIMKALSASSASDMEKAIVNPNTAAIQWENPSGEIEEMNMILTGNRERIAHTDQRYVVGVHHQVVRRIEDDVAGPVAMDLLTQYFPKSLQAELSPKDFAYAIGTLGSVVRNKSGYKLISQLMTPRADNWRAFTESFESMPTLQAQLRHFKSAQDLSATRIADELDEVVHTLKTRKATTQSLADAAYERADDWLDNARELSKPWTKEDELELAVATSMRDQLKEAAAGIEWMQTLSNQARQYLATALTKQFVTGGQAYDVNQMARFLRGDGNMQRQPALVYYRGLNSREQGYINANGDLVLRLGKQDTHFPGEAGVLSMSTDPHQAMTYATSRHLAPDDGVLIEIDGQWANNYFNTTHEETFEAGRTYSNIEYRGPGLYALGPDGQPLTEVAMVLEEGDEIIVPANMWRTHDSKSSERLLDSQQAGRAEWDNTWDLDNFQMEKNYNDVQSALRIQFENASSELGPEGVAVLDTLADELDHNIGRLRAWLDSDSAWSGATEKPESVIGAWFLTDKPLITDEVRAALTAEEVDQLAYVESFLQRVADIELPHGDAADLRTLFRDILTDPENGNYVAGAEYMIDDFFRGVINNQVASTGTYSATLSNGYAAAIDPVLKGSAIHMRGHGKLYDYVYGPWNMRGRGGFTDAVDKMPSPFIEDFDTLRERWIHEVEFQLHRTENQDYVQASEHAIGGDPRIARPPADGLTRAYTPVVPADDQELMTLITSELDEFNAEFQLLSAEFSMGRDNFFSLTGEERQQWLNDLLYLYDDIDVAYRTDAADGAYAILYDMYNDLEQYGFDSAEVMSLSGYDVYNASNELWRSIQRNQADLMAAAESGDFVASWESFYGRAQQILKRQLPKMELDPVIAELSYDEMTELVARVLEKISENRRVLSNVSIPLDSIAYSDPRLARFVTQLLDDNASMQKVGVIEMTREAAKVEMPAQTGVWHQRAYGNAGRQFGLDTRWGNRAIINDAERVQAMTVMLEGTSLTEWVPGISVNQAYREYAERIVDASLADIRRGVQDEFIVREAADGSYVARKFGKEFEKINPGEHVDNNEVFYIMSPDGRSLGTVDWGDPRYFDNRVASDQEELMWNIAMPIIRDKYEEEGLVHLYTNRVEKEKRSIGQIMRREEATDMPSDIRDLRMTHSRIDDVHQEPGAMLPSTTIVQHAAPMYDTWWDRMIRWGFDKVIGPAIDSLARQPMAFHHFAKAYTENLSRVSWLLNRRLFDEDVPYHFSDWFTSLERHSGLEDWEMETIAGLRRNTGNVNQLSDEEWFGRFVDGDYETVHRELTELVQEVRVNALNAVARRYLPEGIDNATAQDLLSHAEEMDEFALWRRAADFADNFTPFKQQALRWKHKTGLIGDSDDPAEKLISILVREIPEDAWVDRTTVASHDIWQMLAPSLNDQQIAMSNEQFAVLKEAVANYRNALKVAEDSATVRAIGDVVPFLDSHEQRSLLAEYGRNMVPFWYAEENFLKRWARTLSHGRFGIPFTNWTVPSGGLDAVRKAQLTYMGLKSVGSIRTDAEGKDWVVYPGSGLLQEAVEKFAPGGVLPIGVLYAAQTDDMLPGLSTENRVGPTPFVALPLDFVSHMFPDMRPVRDAVIGPIGAQRGVVEQFVPSVIVRTWEALFEDEESSIRYNSAMMAAISYMEAEGKGLPDNATSEDVDKYLDKVRNHARIIMLGQALAGFVVPGAPQARPYGEGSAGLAGTLGIGVEDPEGITSELYRSYVQGLGIEEGTAAFLRDFENADLEDVVNPLAFTASGTRSVSGAPLPATEVGVRWYEDNKGWIDQSPEAAAWLMPQPGDNEFEYTAYRQQLAHGLRKKMTAEDFVRSIKYRSAAEVYFRHKEEYDDAVLGVGGDQDTKRAYDEAWALWKSQFLAANPIFAEELQSGDSRVRRDRTITQMRYVINDPQAPESPYSQPIREMVETFDNFQAFARVLRESPTAENRARLRAAKEEYRNWGEAWVLRNPDLRRLWSAVYRPEAGLD